MMISPDTFYEMKLKGKSKEEIMTVIRGLKRKITRLKNVMEHPDYKNRKMAMQPCESVQIAMNREYLKQAKRALKEVGCIYESSKSEIKLEIFNDNIPYISKITFNIGGCFGGKTIKTFIFDDEKIYTNTLNMPHCDIADFDKYEELQMDKNDFLEKLKDLHIGEWRREYNLRRFDCFVMDGTQWSLSVAFSNGCRRVKIHGSNDYPYNFDGLLDLFGIEEKI